MNKYAAFILFGLVLLSHSLVSAQDPEAVARDLAKYWASRARQHQAIKTHQQMLGRRVRERQRDVRRRMIPPWIQYKEPNEEGKKELTLEDLQLWSSIDMDKDGKLTIAEFDRFVSSPQARSFVQRMKDEKAIQQWADKVGIDVAKAKQAMALGAQVQSRAAQQHARRAGIMNARRRQQIAMQAGRRRQQMQQSRANNYFANLGRQYFRAMSGKRRDEL